MFGVGGWELLVILLVALLVLGPEKLPGLARTLGRTMGEFRRVSTEFQRTLNVEAALNETQSRDRNSAARAGTPDQVAPSEAGAADAGRDEADRA